LTLLGLYALENRCYGGIVPVVASDSDPAASQLINLRRCFPNGPW
jgi:hypothetical protein